MNFNALHSFRPADQASSFHSDNEPKYWRKEKDMAFEPLVNIPVRVVDTIIDVSSRGTGDQEHDEVFVTVEIELLADIDASGPVTLILPLAAEAQQQPILRYTDEPINGPLAFTFDPVEHSEADQELIKRLEALSDGASKKEQKALAVSVSRAAKSWSAAVIEVKPGKRHLRLFYCIAADRVAEKEFEFFVIGPMPSFVVQSGGSIGVVALLPRATTVVTAEGLTDPNNPGSAIQRTDANLGGRPAMGWFWQNDPLFRIRYRYA